MGNPQSWAPAQVSSINVPEPVVIDQIVGLSIRYGIVTPYTSFLVTEPMPFGSASQDRIAREQLAELGAWQDEPVYGREAVEKAVGHDALANTNLASLPQAEHSNLLRVVGSRTLILLDGGIWIDTAYDPEKMETVKVSFLSDKYFSLVELFPDLAASFALVPRVIAISEGVAYEGIGEDELVQKMAFPTAVEPEENKDASQVDDLINEQLHSNDEKSEESPQSGQSDSSPVKSAESLEPGNLLPCLDGLLHLMLPGLVWLVRGKGN